MGAGGAAGPGRAPRYNDPYGAAAAEIPPPDRPAAPGPAPASGRPALGPEQPRGKMNYLVSGRRGDGGAGNLPAGGDTRGPSQAGRGAPR